MTAKKFRSFMLMRHAKSDWNSAALDDFSRPLNSRGRRDARAIGRWMLNSGYVPDVILSSPSVRTRETVTRLGKGLGMDLTLRTSWFEELYHASAQQIVHVLQRHGTGVLSMVVAHNPGLEMALDWLTDPENRSSEHRKTFPTAACYVLEARLDAGKIAGGNAQIRCHMRPKLLNTAMPD